MDIKNWGRGRKIFVGALIVFFGIGLLNLFTSDRPTSTASEAQSTYSQEQKDKAGKDLVDLLKTMADAGLIYKVSDDGGTIYVNRAWYDQPVDFKKDALAKISQLKKVALGRQYFEVRDATSNEKVAEVTSFSGSIEVYR